MTASASAHPNRAGRKRRFGPLGWTLVIVAALIAAFVFATQVYTDWLWFSQLGFGGVFMTETLLKAGVFVVTVLLVAVPLWASMSYAVKHAEEPAPAAENPQKAKQQGSDSEEKTSEKPQSARGELQAEATLRLPPWRILTFILREISMPSLLPITYWPQLWIIIFIRVML